MQYTFDPSANCQVSDVAASQQIAERFAPRRSDRDDDRAAFGTAGVNDRDVELGSLFVVGEIVEGMTGVYLEYTYADYQQMVMSIKVVMREGEGKLLQRLRALEAEKESLFAASEFYKGAVAYLLRKASRHGVQVTEFRDEWEHFLCAKVFQAAEIGRERLIVDRVSSSGPVFAGSITAVGTTNVV